MIHGMPAKSHMTYPFSHSVGNPSSPIGFLVSNYTTNMVLVYISLEEAILTFGHAGIYRGIERDRERERERNIERIGDTGRETKF